MVAIIQSIIVNIYFITSGVIISTILYITSFFISQQFSRTLALFLTKHFRNFGYKLLGIKEEHRGLENIPKGPCIFASKHQSSLETLYYFNMFKPNAVYCYKKELMKVPMWGRILQQLGGISIDRQHGSRILFYMQQQVKEYLDKGDSVVIFPEGTRIPCGETGKFKKGIKLLYKENNVPIIPVALNTGWVLPKNSWMIRKNNIIVEFLPPILPNSLPEKDFLPFLENAINTKMQAIEAETKAQATHKC